MAARTLSILPTMSSSPIAVCSRTDAQTWSCQEDELAAVAKKHNLALPNDRAGRNAAAEKLLELVLSDK